MDSSERRRWTHFHRSDSMNALVRMTKLGCVSGLGLNLCSVAMAQCPFNLPVNCGGSHFIPGQPAFAIWNSSDVNNAIGIIGTQASNGFGAGVIGQTNSS